jgi:uncharacterized membrane protein (UPF0127 family)
MATKIRTGELHGPRGLVARNVLWATTFRARYRGVIGRARLVPDEAMVIVRCRQVHSYGVPYPLDAVFCDGSFEVLHVETLDPKARSRKVPGARYCIELLGGRASECGIERGTSLRFEA